MTLDATELGARYLVSQVLSSTLSPIIEVQRAQGLVSQAKGNKKQAALHERVAEILEETVAEAKEKVPVPFRRPD